MGKKAMQDGTVLFWKFKQCHDWIFDFACEEIMRITNSPYVHTAIYLGGEVYESTMWRKNITVLGLKIPWLHGGVRVHPGTGWDEARAPLIAISPQVATRMRDYAKAQISEHRPYNILQLAVMIVVWPTRAFWRRVGWVPFSASLLGTYCSTFVEKCWLSGWSLVPLDDENFASPGELRDSALLR
jgi:hypothetical protein